MDKIFTISATTVKSDSMVELGAVDAPVSDLQTTCFDNKLGGLPDWPPSVNVNFDFTCKICGIKRPLILQCYAPIDKSPYHRTLYIFACINSNCWNKSESWSCIRVQYKDDPKVVPMSDDFMMTDLESTNWCTEADDWEEEDILNGNNVDSSSSFAVPKTSKPIIIDEDMDDIITGTENLKCSDVYSRLHELEQIQQSIQEPTAEIEDSDCQHIVMDAPVVPKCDINAIINQKPKLPDVLQKDDVICLKFESSYIRVFTEEIFSYSDGHIEDLLERYQMENSEASMKSTPKLKSIKKTDDTFCDEEYEKTVPLHGDALFHSFLSRIKMNPEQVVRYSLGGEPLLLSELIPSNSKMSCSNCSGDMWFELQVLPTLIPALRLSGTQETVLEFGNVIIFTCKKSCWRDSDVFLHENVILQMEP